MLLLRGGRNSFFSVFDFDLFFFWQMTSWKADFWGDGLCERESELARWALHATEFVHAERTATVREMSESISKYEVSILELGECSQV